MKLIDITGNRYGRLTVIEYAGKSKWVCLCDCGNVVTVKACDIKAGNTRSCKCIRHEYLVNRNKSKATHRMTGSRLYHIWLGMKSRCYYPNHPEYKYYGGNGVTVCEEWRTSFETFSQWAVANGYADGLTIDRINTRGNYEPLNCRWATYKEQENNKTNNRLVTIHGVTKTLSEWSDYSGINYGTLQYRVKNEWPEEMLLIRPKSK